MGRRHNSCMALKQRHSQPALRLLNAPCKLAMIHPKFARRGSKPLKSAGGHYVRQRTHARLQKVNATVRTAARGVLRRCFQPCPTEVGWELVRKDAPNDKAK